MQAPERSCARRSRAVLRRSDGVKKVLMIAFHFPPVAMGSGHLRTLGFVRYLPDCGWEPTVLSVNARALPRVDAGKYRSDSR